MNPETGSDAPLSSTRHPLAVRIRKIGHRPQLARRLGLFLLDGIHLLEEATLSPHEPEVVLVSPRLRQTSSGEALLERIAARGWTVRDTTDALMERLSPTDTPQGILALVRRPGHEPSRCLPRRSAADGEAAWGQPARALLLSGVQDPRNLGALARSARAFGYRSLITTSQTADPFHVRALRASSGTLLHMNIAAGVSTEQITDWRQTEDVLLIALIARGGDPVGEVAARALRGERPMALVLGSEGQGISPALAGMCEERASIPMVADAESLGVAAAGVLALYLVSSGGERSAADA